MEVVKILKDILLELITLIFKEICINNIEVKRFINKVEAKENKLINIIIENKKHKNIISNILIKL